MEGSCLFFQERLEEFVYRAEKQFLRSCMKQLSASAQKLYTETVTSISPAHLRERGQWLGNLEERDFHGVDRISVSQLMYFTYICPCHCVVCDKELQPICIIALEILGECCLKPGEAIRRLSLKWIYLLLNFIPQMHALTFFSFFWLVTWLFLGYASSGW